MEGAMNPRIEALWSDRRDYILTGTVFGDVRLFEELARDAAADVPHLRSHPLGYHPRVVIDVASERLIGTGAYFGPETALHDGHFGPRLVIGPCVADGEDRFLIGLEAAETYASSFGRLIGEWDGYVRVLSFPPSRLASGRPLPAWPAR
jgi:hypothetical protein